MNIDEYHTRQGQTVVERLIEAIEKDSKIASTCSLSLQAIRDNLPAVCETIMEAIAENDLSLVGVGMGDQGSQHGITRSAQNFEPEEIVREFFLLKQIILAELKPQLLESSPDEIINRLALIDYTIDRVMENCFEQYAKCRQQQVDSLHQQIFLTNQEVSRLLAEHQDSIDYLVHEIKNPLTSIIGYSDLYLRLQRQSNNKIANTNLEHIQQVLSQGQNVLRLINDTLELSSYQKGNLKLRIKEIDVCLLLEDIIVSLKPTLEAKKLDLVASCAPERLVIRSDSLRIQQIITNLLTNAIRYTASGTITLGCNLTVKNQLEIKISDTGIGISWQNRDRIFEPYFRSDISQVSVPEGIGMGLAIVSQLVNLLGGEIELNSEVNVGSTFTVRIPVDSVEEGHI